MHHLDAFVRVLLNILSMDIEGVTGSCDLW